MEGDTREAVLGILDLFQLARDLSSNSTAPCVEAASRIWSISTMELQELLFSEEFPRLDLAEVDEALQRLDRDFPKEGPILLNNALVLGFELLKPEESRGREFQVPLYRYWRYAYSRRIADADAFDLILAGVRRVAPRRDGPAREARGFQAESFIPYRPFIAPQWDYLFPRIERRHTRTLLRLLRMAVHYRATGEILELEDPYGDRLHHEIHGSDLKVWSVGGDGVDNGGDDAGGDWSRKRPTPIPGVMIPGVMMRAPRDIVLTVER